MKFYRIKQTGDEFIPQVAESLFDRLSNHWRGIDKKEYSYTWYGKDLQEKYCIHNSLIDARLTVEKHKKHFKNFRPKYHKA
jgi:hypothetical protein